MIAYQLDSKTHQRLAGALLVLLLVALGLMQPALSGSALADGPGGNYSDSEARRIAEDIEDQIVESVAKVSEAYVRIGGGSGVVISPDGYMLTNNHVAQGNNYVVMLPSGKRHLAINIGQDVRGDINLMRIQTDEPLPYVEMGDSDAVEVGQYVIAMGNPFLYAAEDAKPTITLGIVSAMHRFQQGYSDAIQVDARINPGNSGGPLISLDGKLLGINGRIAVRRTFGTRINTGIGFAIPSNQIRRFVMRWHQVGGVVYHACINGLEIANASTEGAGARVAAVAEDSKAERVGLLRNDVIVAVDDYPVYSRNRFWGIIGTYPEGWPIELTYERGGERHTVELLLNGTATTNQGAELPVQRREDDRPGVPPVEPGRVPGSGYLGVTVNLDLDPETDGVPVYRVLTDHAADKAGLRPGDIIIEIDGARLLDVDDLRVAVRDLAVGDRIRIVFLRNDEQREVVAILGARPSD